MSKFYNTIEKYIGLMELDGDILHVMMLSTTCNDGKPYNHRLNAGFGFINNQYRHRIDRCFSLDENLQQFIEKIKRLLSLDEMGEPLCQSEKK